MLLSFPPNLAQALENLRVLTEKKSQVAVISQALATYEYLWREKAEGSVIIIRRADTTEHEFFLE
jgi:hypothetical protein